jgi:phospholipid transport system transporter-binding protein
MYKAEQELSLNNAVISVQTGLLAIAQGQTDIDLSALARLDSSAVAVMLEWQRAANAVGKAIIFHGVPATLSSLIALYGVSDFLTVAPSERH